MHVLIKAGTCPECKLKQGQFHDEICKLRGEHYPEAARPASYLADLCSDCSSGSKCIANGGCSLTGRKVTAHVITNNKCTAESESEAKLELNVVLKDLKISIKDRRDALLRLKLFAEQELEKMEKYPDEH